MAQLPPGVDPSTIPFLAPPPEQTSNFVNPLSLAPVTEGVGGLFLAIETILVILRTFTNVKTFGKLRLEDYWGIFATTLTYGYFALLMRLRPIARHEWDIPVTEATDELYKTAFAQEMLLGSTMFFGKTCLLLLFHRVFSPDKYFRYKLYGAFIFIGATTLSSIPMYLAMCLPGSNGSWADADTNCDRTVVFGYIQGPVSVAFDLFLIYLPTSIIIHLHLPLRRRLGILAIFMTGMLALAASIIGLVYRIELMHDSDATWGGYIVELCLLIESCVSIICSCMPTIPATSKLIAANSYFVTLRSRLLSRYASFSKSKSSKGQSWPRSFLGNRHSSESEPYIELVERRTDRIDTYLAPKTYIQHVARPKVADRSGINISIDFEVSSVENTGQNSSKV